MQLTHLNQVVCIAVSVLMLFYTSLKPQRTSPLYLSRDTLLSHARELFTSRHRKREDLGRGGGGASVVLTQALLPHK